jgi:hypothetical protein
MEILAEGNHVFICADSVLYWFVQTPIEQVITAVVVDDVSMGRNWRPATTRAPYRDISNRIGVPETTSTTAL